MNLAQAKRLRVGQTIYAKRKFNADGTAMRCRVNGKVQTWKTRPNEVKIPYKRGLYEYGYITERDLSDFTLTEPAPRRPVGKLVYRLKR
jgi:hypothetical protein